MLVAGSGGGDAIGGGSGNASAPPQSAHHHHPPNLRRQSKTEISDAFVRSLRERGGLDVDAPGVASSIRSHFQLLPSRYALDVNLASLDVFNHKRLLDSARADPSAVSFQVRPVDVVALSTAASSPGGNSMLMRPSSTAEGRSSSGGLNRAPSFSSSHSLLAEAAAAGARAARPRAALPRPAFGSSPNLQALVLDAADARPEASFYEVTIASVDQPKLLSRLSEALGDLNLNICEAHAFNTLDRFSLDVFVVNGWAGETADELEDVLSERLAQLPSPGASSPPRGGPNANAAGAAADSQPGAGSLTPIGGGGAEGGTTPSGVSPSGGSSLADGGAGGNSSANAVNSLVPTSALPRPPPSPDDFELDAAEVVCHERVAAGAFGDLYRGTYCGTDVAVKILRNAATDTAQFAEFLQEVHIMRKVRHRNVVQFIGACTQRPNLCIVFEYLPGGSVFDWMRARGPPALLALLKMGAEVARGMDYLHKRRVVHRDLKAANLLDDAGCVKIADFGVARLLDAGGGVMTAETGTYRWMAPEIITHAPYDEKADVYSYGILLWELLTGKVPYAERTPLQAAVGVVQKGLRPTIPAGCPANLAELMRACWTQRPEDRPDFEAIKGAMETLYMEARAEEEKRAAAQAAAVGGQGASGSGGSGGAAASGGGGLLSKLRRFAGGGGGGGANNQPPPPSSAGGAGGGGGNAAQQA